MKILAAFCLHFCLRNGYICSVTDKGENDVDEIIKMGN